ncbi:MAG: ATP synthase subunit I [Polyangiales bacterium]
MSKLLVLGFVVGLLLGVFFYGGLWLTIRRAVSSTHAALWFPPSMLARSGLTVAGFYFVSRAHWEMLPACLLGFFVTSVVLARWARAPQTKPVRTVPEATDAS